MTENLASHGARPRAGPPRNKPRLSLYIVLLKSFYLRSLICVKAVNWGMSAETAGQLAEVG